ncbi:Rv0518 family GDSL lipase [Mycobacterium sp. Marseille-P9652]|uniref:Rv0518 family GDSL lipase n=1 Tax=Mycobacterium sp. Marseille-P9652 TaxID=2654950 RepID=UPI0012E8EC9E|nr:GDSL lipase [Mycobacterium sp. Marseille-P9652]
MSRVAAFVAGLALVVVLVGWPGQVQAGNDLTMLTQDYRLLHVAIVSDSYTTGTNEGGEGPRSWPARASQILTQAGERIVPDVAAEGRAGYVVRGDHGSVFEDLVPRAVKPDDALVVFFGSRNDQGVDPGLLAGRVSAALDLARRLAPSARLLVIGPPWPTADVPPAMFAIRDVLGAAAAGVGASWVDPIADRWFVDRPDLIGADGVHPTDAGHQYMADMIAPLIHMQLPPT